jgi:Domain of unknown function (DUF4189)
MIIKRVPTRHHIAAASLPLLSALMLSTSVSAPAMAQQQVIFVPPPIVCGPGTYAINNGCMELTPQSFVAVAYHPDANDIWAAALYASKEGARNAATTACESDMRVETWGCKWTWQTKGGYLGVARGADGGIYTATAPKKNEVQKLLADACKVYELGCTPIGMFKHTDDFRTRGNRNAPDNIRRPKDMANLRKLYASASWVGGASHTGKFWAATGRSTMKQAQDDALALCHIQNKENPACAIVATTGNGVILSYKRGTDNAVIVEQSEARARQAVAQQCQREKLTCNVIDVLDARQDGVFEKAFL